MVLKGSFLRKWSIKGNEGFCVAKQELGLSTYTLKKCSLSLNLMQFPTRNLFSFNEVQRYFKSVGAFFFLEMNA